MGTILLVRHGQADSTAYARSSGDPAQGPLTEIGADQSRQAGVAVRDRTRSVDAGITGSLYRHRQTYESMTESGMSSAHPTIDDRWNEYDIDSILGGSGEAAKSTGKQLQKRVDEALLDWVSDSIPGYETYASFQDRVHGALQDVTRLAGPGRTVLVVSSAGVISQVLANVWGMSGPEWARMSRTMLNASITKLIVGSGGRPAVVSMNEHAHLETVDHSLMTYR